METFPGSEATHKLYQRGFVGVIDAGINIDADFINPVNELEV